MNAGHVYVLRAYYAIRAASAEVTEDLRHNEYPAVMKLCQELALQVPSSTPYAWVPGMNVYLRNMRQLRNKEEGGIQDTAKGEALREGFCAEGFSRGTYS